MELYNTDNVTADLDRIKAKVAEYYKERFAAGTIREYTVTAGYDNMDRFWASCEYLPTVDGDRFGPITAHFTILIRDGEIVFC